MRGVVRLVLVLAVMVLTGWMSSVPARADGLAVRDVRLGLQGGGLTRFVLETEQPVDYRLFLLNNPPRAVVDLPPLAWTGEVPPAAKGLVKGWRHGRFGAGTRIVLDLSGPADVKAVLALPPSPAGGGARLVIDLASASASAFAQLMGKAWGRGQNLASTIPATLPAGAGSGLPAAGRLPVPLPRNLPDFRKVQLPLIVVDPGHGGVDPGAEGGAGGRYEKDLTLAVARQLAVQYEATGRYRVSLTRSRDIFIPLRERVAIARRLGADLFVSLHADSINRREVTGATVYTLSAQASDREAAAMAESENRADLLAGLDQVGGDDNLAAILTTMSYSASVNEARKLSGFLVGEMGRVIRLHERPQRAAGFAVLKSPDIPSVLVEMGYLSSPVESRRLFSPAHQRKLVKALVSATDRYFQARDPSFISPGQNPKLLMIY